MAILKNTTISGTNNLTLAPSDTANRPNIITSLIRWTNTGSQSFSVLMGPTPTVSNTSWTAPAGVTQVEVLVVAGGGGGGHNGGGGGGAGGLLYSTAYTVTPGTSYNITVGTGGAPSTASVNLASNGTNSVFDALTAFGGGGGNSRSVSGSILAGGSGGGGGSAIGSASQAAGQGIAGQGTNGGAGTAPDLGANAAGGGGGGAGQSGQAGTHVLAGGGGHGLNFSITGTPTWYAGGGGGGTCVNGLNPAQGGLGGGGSGGIATSANGVAGTAGTGGGGGGGNGAGAAATGGSGVVIIKYSVASNNVNSLGIMQYNKDLRAVEVYEGTATGWISQDPMRNFAGHNLLTNSNLKGNELSVETIWTKTNNSTDVLAPDGSALTTKCVSGSSGDSFFWQTGSITYKTNTVYTKSVYVRVASGTGAISFNNGVNASQVINPTTAWQRFTFTFTTTGSVGPVYYLGFVGPSLNTTFYFWGWQLEEGITASPYISTTTAASPIPTSLGGYRYHTYTTVGTSGFSPAVTGNVEILVVGGGGAGGRNGTVDGAGGGGAGGVLYTQSYPVTSGQQYTVVVGAGGVGVASPNTNSNDGNPSQFGTLVAIGGGKGGGESSFRTGGPGGSGGGAGGYASKPGGMGIVGQGFSGGPCSGPGDGGGGGAGGPGGSGITGTGGHGKYFPQFTSVGGFPAGWFGGGGGASGDMRNGVRSSAAGKGGIGGGGNGAPATTGGTAQSGSANTGGGGGGAAGSGNGSYPSVGSVIAPGSGGLGIVIVRYRYD